MSKNLDALLQKYTSGATDIDPAPIGTCKRVWAALRHELGLVGAPRLLGQPKDNIKIAKSHVPTYTLTCSAHRTSGEYNTCVKSTPQCRLHCVMLTAGNAYYNSVIDGRAARTLFLGRHPFYALSMLTHEVRALEARGEPFGLRLNVASDLRWEYIAPWLFDGNNVRAYDYTKWDSMDRRNHMPNYRLTFSHSERWDADKVSWYLRYGMNVAVVFDRHKHDLPDTYLGFPVIDGDLSDYRYDDPRGRHVVGLAAKGTAQTLQVGGFKVRAS